MICLSTAGSTAQHCTTVTVTHSKFKRSNLASLAGLGHLKNVRLSKYLPKGVAQADGDAT